MRRRNAASPPSSRSAARSRLPPRTKLKEERRIAALEETRRAEEKRKEDERLRLAAIPDDDKRAEFVRKIQQVLKRSRCYDGAVTGRSTDAQDGLDKFVDTAHKRGKPKPTHIELAKATVGDFETWLKDADAVKDGLCVPVAKPAEKPAVKAGREACAKPAAAVFGTAAAVLRGGGGGGGGGGGECPDTGHPMKDFTQFPGRRRPGAGPSKDKRQEMIACPLNMAASPACRDASTAVSAPRWPTMPRPPRSRRQSARAPPRWRQCKTIPWSSTRSYATVTNGPAAAPRARPKVAEPRAGRVGRRHYAGSIGPPR